jgi:tRNA A37 methylthiotransferase MiaB
MTEPRKRILRRPDNSMPRVAEIIDMPTQSEVEKLLRELRRPALYRLILALLHERRQRLEASRHADDDAAHRAYIEWARR